jgi:O-methyltransferase
MLNFAFANRLVSGRSLTRDSNMQIPGDNTTARVIRKALRPVRPLANQIKRRLAVPALLSLGWRPPAAAPVEASYLRYSFGYDEEDEIRAAIAQVYDHTVVSYERLATLWLQVRHLDRCVVPGDLVECGTFRGGATAMMALAHMASHTHPVRRLHLFDSFQGLPEPRIEVDGAALASILGRRTSGALVSIGHAVCSLQEPKALLEERIRYPSDLINYHVGWFQETLPVVVPSLGDIALLRLDGDWYDSTRVCLEYLYSKVVSDGVVVIDDYGHVDGCRRAVDEFLGTLTRRPMLHHIDYTGRYWLKA